jgi:hypothetical protein
MDHWQNRREFSRKDADANMRRRVGVVVALADVEHFLRVLHTLEAGIDGADTPGLILREKPEDGFVKLDNIVASLVQAAKLSKLLTTTAITI